MFVRLAWQRFNAGDYMQTVQPDLFFISTMLMGTIDFYHLVPLSLTLTLSGEQQGQCKEISLGFIFSHIFQHFLAYFLAYFSTA